MDVKKMTAVEWLQGEIEKFIDMGNTFTHEFEKAKAMEKEQIMKAARQCHFEGLRQTGKNSEEYLKYGNDYYNQTFNK
jgi:hypothetical protein